MVTFVSFGMIKYFISDDIIQIKYYMAAWRYKIFLLLLKNILLVQLAHS